MTIRVITSFGIVFLIVAAIQGVKSATLNQVQISGGVRMQGSHVIDPDASFTLVIAGDPHVGRPATFDAGEPSNNIVHMITAHNPQYLIFAGDICDQAAYTQAVTWSNIVVARSNAGNQIWTVPGNHDACSECGDVGGCDAGDSVCSETYSNFQFTINAGSSTFHWTKNIGIFRFIGFDSRQKREEPNLGFGKVEDAEYAWLTNEIAVSAALGRKSIIVTHYPLLDFYGNNIKVHQAEIINAMSNAGNVLIYFGAHRHGWGERQTNAGTVHISLPGVSYSQLAFDSPYSGEGGYYFVHVSNRTWNGFLYACDEPTYTARPNSNFSLAY